MHKTFKFTWSAISVASLYFILGAQSFVTPCVYQSDKCGSTLATLYGYSNAELIAAVNQTSSIPPISTFQLFQVLYRCEDINGGIVGNSLCVDGCLASPNATRDDQCQLSGGTTTTTTVTVTTPAPVSCYKKCQTFCFGGECSKSTTNQPAITPTMTPLFTY